jgi:hypothetical protein
MSKNIVLGDKIVFTLHSEEFPFKFTLVSTRHIFSSGPQMTNSLSRLWLLQHPRLAGNWRRLDVRHHRNNVHDVHHSCGSMRPRLVSFGKRSPLVRQLHRSGGQLVHVGLLSRYPRPQEHSSRESVHQLPHHDNLQHNPFFMALHRAPFHQRFLVS